MKKNKKTKNQPRVSKGRKSLLKKRLHSAYYMIVGDNQIHDMILPVIIDIKDINQVFNSLAKKHLGFEITTKIRDGCLVLERMDGNNI